MEGQSFGSRLEAGGGGDGGAKASSAARRSAPAPSRDNKNRPQQLSSKRQVKRFRVASGLAAGDVY